MRIDVMASAAGVVAAGAVIFSGLFFPDELLMGAPTHCLFEVCAGWARNVGLPLAEAGAAVLLVAAMATFVAPRFAFYAEAVVSGILAVFLLSQWGSGGLYWGSVLLSMATTVLALISARGRGAMSEQGNPMNLPVFG